MQDRYSLVVGRFQPLHDGHKGLIQKLIDEGKKVCVALMDTEADEKNPYSVAERIEMFHKSFGDTVKIAVIPPIAEMCYGRNVGYHVRPIYLDYEGISATSIRNGTKPNGFEPDVGFLEGFQRVGEKIHEISANQGLWPDDEKTDISYKIAHAVSELAEAWECARDGKQPDKNISEMTGVEVQLADALGILMDMEVAYGLHIAEALLRKMEFNAGREWLHGRKKF
jgi:hypothetical protein